MTSQEQTQTAPQAEPTLSLDLTPDEFDALSNLLDAGVKQQGLASAVPAAVISQKMEAAVRVYRASQSASA